MISTRTFMPKCRHCEQLVRATILHDFHNIGVYKCPSCKILTSAYIGQPLKQEKAVNQVG